MGSGFQRVNKNEIGLSGVKEIVVMGDVGCTGLNEESRRVFCEILKNKADLYFIVGDLVHTGSKAEFDEFIDLCNTCATVPVYSLCGNHDLPGYYQCCGRSSYVLVLDRTVIVALDNSNARFKEEDIALLREALEKNRDKRFIIFFHIPPPLDFEGGCMRRPQWDLLRGVLDGHKDRIECIICAHVHGYHKYSLDGYTVYISAGGGASMIYDMPDEKDRFFHALKLSIRDNEAVDIATIPIK